MNKYIKQLTESLFDDIDDIFSDDEEDIEILSALEDVYLPYVDLGLPSGTLWYKCNLGAKHEYDPGLYFQWGDTQGYKNISDKAFNTKNYNYYDGSCYSITKYCISSDYGIVDNKIILDNDDDAAYIESNGICSMPTDILVQELVSKCKWKVETINNVMGYKVTSKENDNYIFFPFAGYLGNIENNSKGRCGIYWTKNMASKCSIGALILYLAKNGIINPDAYRYRHEGFSIRPVVTKNKLNNK